MDLDSACFYSNDIDKVIPFYKDALGFSFDHRTERFVSFIFPNGARLGIKNQTEEREKPGFQTVFIKVADVEKIYLELKEKGLEIYKELQERPWGKEFSILDPDKNKILYIQYPK